MRIVAALTGWALIALVCCTSAHAVDNQTVAKCVVNPATPADGETMPLPCNVSGQLVTSSTGGGGGGTVDQGTAAAAASAWPVQLVIGGAVNAIGNPIFVKPGTGATFSVTGTFWQTTQPISAASLPLPSGAASSANQSSILTALGSPFQAGGSIGNTAFTANAGTNLNTSALALETGGNLAQIVTDAGAPGATACATDTGSCNFNQQLQRLAQRLTTINTTLGTPATAANQSTANTSLSSILSALGSPFQAGGSIGNTAFTANAGTNLNTSALALETGGNLAQLVTDSGAPGATACATDTGSCNFNQQLQRLAQRLTAINTTLGSPLQASGTVQPGNTANTTPWLVTPKGVQDSGGTDMTDTTLHAIKAEQIVNTGNAASLAHICGSSVTVNPSTATDTLAVEISGSTDIYICDVSGSSNGTNNFFLESAASTSCASTKVQIGNTWYTQQFWGKTAANPYYRGMHTGAGKGLCVNTSAANALSVTIHYDQY